MVDMVCTRDNCIDTTRICKECEYNKAVYDPKVYKLVPIGEESEPCKDATPWTRKRVLSEAERCVCGQREQDYGTPDDSFNLIAKLWTTYVSTGSLVDLVFDAKDVAAMMALLKIARISENPQHMDSWVDLAGYAACGGEIAGKEENN